MAKIGISVEDIEQAFVERELESRKLANAGWTLPIHLTPGEVTDILATNDIEALDDYFFEYYTRDDNTNLNFVFEKISTDPQLDKWGCLIRECVSAYREGYYQIIIPSLILILEGMLATMLIGEEKRKTNMERVTRKKLENFSIGSMHRIIWVSVYSFVACLFKNSHFDENRPPFINRHWIMHGRDTIEWKQVDSIRLFVAINTMQRVVVSAFTGKNE